MPYTITHYLHIVSIFLKLVIVNYHAASNVASWFSEWPDRTGSPQA